MAVLTSFIQVFIVLGMYNFALQVSTRFEVELTAQIRANRFGEFSHFLKPISLWESRGCRSRMVVLDPNPVDFHLSEEAKAKGQEITW